MLNKLNNPVGDILFLIKFRFFYYYIAFSNFNKYRVMLLYWPRTYPVLGLFYLLTTDHMSIKLSIYSTFYRAENLHFSWFVLGCKNSYLLWVIIANSCVKISYDWSGGPEQKSKAFIHFHININIFRYNKKLYPEPVPGVLCCTDLNHL